MDIGEREKTMLYASMVWALHVLSTIIRNIKFPNTSYGEDYAIGLNISRDYKIGRIYDIICHLPTLGEYSDAALSIEKSQSEQLL